MLLPDFIPLKWSGAKAVRAKVVGLLKHGSRHSFANIGGSMMLSAARSALGLAIPSLMNADSLITAYGNEDLGPEISRPARM